MAPQDPKNHPKARDTATDTGTIANEATHATTLAKHESNKAAGESGIPNAELPT